MGVKRFALSCLLLLLKLYSGAQDTSLYFDAVDVSGRNFQERVHIIGVRGGFGKYLQNDLKGINQSVQKGLSFSTSMTDNFPVTLYYGSYLLFRIGKEITLGPDYQYQTTGSRLAYSDYSGSYTFDQVLSCHSLGMRMEVLSEKNKKSELFICFVFGIGFSKWSVNEKLVVGDIHKSSSERFDALRPFIYPALKLRYKLTPLISLVPAVGFSLDVPTKYHVHNQKDAITDKAASWTGPRADFTIEFSY
jgi:hypothetical protein